MMQPKYLWKHFGACNQIILHNVDNRTRKWSVVIFPIHVDTFSSLCPIRLSSM